MSGRLKIHGIDEDKAREAIDRWFRNPYYRRLCKSQGIRGPKDLFYLINEGNLGRVSVIPDIDTKLKPFDTSTGIKRGGGNAKKLTEGLIDDYKGDVVIDISSATSGNYDVIPRTPEEIKDGIGNYYDSFVKSKGIDKYDLVLTLFPSRTSLERRAKKAKKDLTDFSEWIRQKTGGDVFVRAQTLSGIDAAERLGPIESILNFNLLLTILNSTILRPWKHGVPVVYPDIQRAIELLENYKGKKVMLGASPIFAWLLALELQRRDLRYPNVYVHGGGGGYDGRKGAIVIPGGIDQTEYAELMRHVFGEHPTETYGYSGHEHVLILRWDPYKEWIDVDVNDEKRPKEKKVHMFLEYQKIYVVKMFFCMLLIL